MRWITHGATLLLLCAVQFSIFSPAARADSGGADGGGGGNTDPRADLPLTREELTTLVGEAKRFLVPILQHQEFLAKDEGTGPGSLRDPFGKDPRATRTLESAMGKIFPGDEAKDIFRELETAKFRLGFDQPCRDLHQRAKDASAFNPGSEICISGKRLLPKLRQKNAVSEVMGLLAHELAHRQGANEAEARAFQKSIQDRLQTGTRMEFLVALNLGEQARYYRREYEDLAKVIAAAPPANELALCMKLVGLSRALAALVHTHLETNPGRGISVYRYSDLRALYAAYGYSEVLESFCRETPAGEPGTTKGAAELAVSSLRYISEVLNGRGPVQLGEEHGCFEPGRYLDYDSLKFNFSQLSKNFDQVLRAKDLSQVF